MPQSSEAGLTHLDTTGAARMVDVSDKPATLREAKAKGRITLLPSTLTLLLQGNMPKGDVFSVARIAAIQGVKETSRLIPLCHPLPVSSIAVDFLVVEPDSIEVTVRVKTYGPTGVEMEALTGVHIALLTIYDMCKAVDKSMVMGNIRLVEKLGGKSGSYIRKE
ncbi:MAG: cyclic pyranopterin monophosphate synthase MoaC [Spirochaetes bacterium]|nr:cyclic pyranopterin monophosphate synthase MoaC [Spirochaetota bacterium]